MKPPNTRGGKAGKRAGTKSGASVAKRENTHGPTGTAAPTLTAKLLRALAATSAVVVFAAVLFRLGLIPDIETTVRDAQMRLNRVRPSEVVLVRITDADYDTLFESRSPLNAEEVASIINAVARGNPAVIGIDLDTSAKSFADLPRIVSRKVHVVWARDAQTVDDGMLRPARILGGNDGDAASGLSVVPQDEDGLVRSYWRLYPLNRGDGIIEERSFPWAVVRDSGRRSEERNVANGPLEIRLARQRPGGPSANVEVSAGQLVDLKCSVSADCAPGMDDNALKGLFEGKIVLIGGSYRAARDAHSTPVGAVNGMDLVAQIIDTELHGGGPRQQSWFVIVVVLLFENIGLVVIGHFWKPEKTFSLWFAISIAASVAASLICSRVSFGTYIGMVFFLPVFCSVLLLDLYATTQALRNRMIGNIYKDPSE